MIQSISGIHCVLQHNLIDYYILYNNMLKQYSAACTRIVTWNLNMLMLMVVEKAIYQAQNHAKLSPLLSPNSDPYVTILSVTI